MDQLKGGYQAMKTANKVRSASNKVTKMFEGGDEQRESKKSKKSSKSSRTMTDVEKGSSKLDRKANKKASSSMGSRDDMKDQLIDNKSETQSMTSSKRGKPLSPMIYLFVAPFPDMIVYENHIETRVATGKFSAEMYEVLNKY